MAAVEINGFLAAASREPDPVALTDVWIEALENPELISAVASQIPSLFAHFQSVIQRHSIPGLGLFPIPVPLYLAILEALIPFERGNCEVMLPIEACSVESLGRLTPYLSRKTLLATLSLCDGATEHLAKVTLHPPALLVEEMRSASGKLKKTILAAMAIKAEWYIAKLAKMREPSLAGALLDQIPDPAGCMIEHYAELGCLLMTPSTNFQSWFRCATPQQLVALLGKYDAGISVDRQERPGAESTLPHLICVKLTKLAWEFSLQNDFAKLHDLALAVASNQRARVLLAQQVTERADILQLFCDCLLKCPRGAASILSCFGLEDALSSPQKDPGISRIRLWLSESGSHEILQTLESDLPGFAGVGTDKQVRLLQEEIDTLAKAKSSDLAIAIGVLNNYWIELRDVPQGEEILLSHLERIKAWHPYKRVAFDFSSSLAISRVIAGMPQLDPDYTNQKLLQAIESAVQRRAGIVLTPAEVELLHTNITRLGDATRLWVRSNPDVIKQLLFPVRASRDSLVTLYSMLVRHSEDRERGIRGLKMLLNDISPDTLDGISASELAEILSPPEALSSILSAPSVVARIELVFGQSCGDVISLLGLGDDEAFDYARRMDFVSMNHDDLSLSDAMSSDMGTEIRL